MAWWETCLYIYCIETMLVLLRELSSHLWGSAESVGLYTAWGMAGNQAWFKEEGQLQYLQQKPFTSTILGKRKSMPFVLPLNASRSLVLTKTWRIY